VGCIMVRPLSAPLRHKCSFERHPHPGTGAVGTKQCRWCKIAVPAGRRHGSERKYCCPRHRQAFWRAFRRYMLDQLKSGHITVEMLQDSLQSVDACAGKGQTAIQDRPHTPLPAADELPS